MFLWKNKATCGTVHTTFGCELGIFSFRYLGIPMHYKKLRNSDLKSVEDRFEQQLTSRKGKNLFAGGR